MLAVHGGRVVEIKAFGGFAVLYNGLPIPTIKSRYAREILLFMSIHQGPARREYLVEQLLPDITDHRTGRRRLTQELSRLQSQFDFPLWDTTPNTVDVHTGLWLLSDIGRFLQERPRPGDTLRYLHELDSLTKLAEAGEPLVGHESAWSFQIREEVLARESAVCEELATALGPADQMAALKHAERWAHIEPFNDQAHRLTHQLIRDVRGQVAASRYEKQLTDLYRHELGVEPAASLFDDVDYGDERRPQLRQQIAALQNLLADATDSHRGEVLTELDDVVRVIGDGALRQEVVQTLTKWQNEQDVDPEQARELAWRQADLALDLGRLVEAEEILNAVQVLPDGESSSTDTPAMFTITRAKLLWAQGRCGEGERLAITAISSATDIESEIEARLLLSTLRDRSGDSSGSRDEAIHALDLARRADIGHLTARALASVGWCLARTEHAAEAEATLADALELAERFGCDAVRVSTLGALGHLSYMNKKPATAYAQFARAAELAKQIKDVTSFIRWSSNAANALIAIGETSKLYEYLAELRLMPQAAEDPGLDTRISYQEAWAALSLGRAEEAVDKAREALALHAKIDDPVTRHYTTNLLVFALLESGLADEAVAVATELWNEVERLDLTPYMQAGFSATLGRAQIKAGQVEEGMARLTEFMAHRNPNQILDGMEYGAYYEGALKLGLTEEAEWASRAVRQMVDTLRKDISDVQWEMAKRQSFYVRCILPALESTDITLNDQV